MSLDFKAVARARYDQHLSTCDECYPTDPERGLRVYDLCAHGRELWSVWDRGSPWNAGCKRCALAEAPKVRHLHLVR